MGRYHYRLLRMSWMNQLLHGLRPDCPQHHRPRCQLRHQQQPRRGLLPLRR